MAVVTLSTVHVNSLAVDGTWSEHMVLMSASGLQQSETGNMRKRDATGNRSIITILPGDTETWTIDCGIADPVEVAWLRQFRKKLCCFRDMDGNRIFGVYTDVTRSRFTWDQKYQLSLTITAVDYTAGT